MAELQAAARIAVHSRVGFETGGAMDAFRATPRLINVN